MYGFNIKDFIAEITKSGVAHPTRYSVIFESTPTGRIKLSRSEQEKINTRLESISFPEVSIGSKALNLAGLDREMPYGRIYNGDISMEFLEDERLSIRSMFERWQGQVIDEETLRVGYYNNYTCNMRIILDNNTTDEARLQGGAAYSVTVHDVWPKTIEAIELGAGKGDELVKTKIGLSFRMWKSDSQFLLAGKTLVKAAGVGSLFGI